MSQAPKNIVDAFFFAIETGDMPTFKALLTEHKDVLVQSRNKNNQTPLMVSAQWWRDDMARELIEKGADVNAKDKVGRTALFYAATSEDRSVTTLLLDAGAKKNLKDTFQLSVCNYAPDHMNKLIQEHKTPKKNAKPPAHFN